MDRGPGSIIMELERKLSSERFKRRAREDNYTKISINYYWDLLKYVDDDYLTDWEILKFKDLYAHQLGNMACQTASCFALGFGSTYILMSPTIKSATHGFLLRMPLGLLLSAFLCNQSGHWMRPNQYFHDIM
mmetsp:Transcript_8801/g.7777  ORF Transcript_8801/g.7777 Transcript_8801/m.7777 type:complete len:132 (-) Transcript_8801:220-615(-)